MVIAAIYCQLSKICARMIMNRIKTGFKGALTVNIFRSEAAGSRTKTYRLIISSHLRYKRSLTSFSKIENRTCHFQKLLFLKSILNWIGYPVVQAISGVESRCRRCNGTVLSVMICLLPRIARFQQNLMVEDSENEMLQGTIKVIKTA